MLFAHINFLGFLIAFGIGLGFGSYATMPAYRLPRGLVAAGRWIGTRSACPACGHQLRTRDLLPVFNWLLTRGKCQFCKAPISANYFFIEATITLFSLLLYWRYNLTEPYLLLLGTAVCLVILTSTDWLHRVMPNAVLVVMVMLGLSYRILQDHTLYWMVSEFMVVVFALMAYAEWFEKKRGEKAEFKYLKLIAIAALFLDIPHFAVFGILALFFVILLKLLNKPVGAALMLAFGLSLFIATMPLDKTLYFLFFQPRPILMRENLLFS